MITFHQWVEAIDQKRKIFVLVGPPSVGKSTWIANTFHEKPYIISRDNIVDNVASSLGMTYDDMFAAPPATSKLGDVDPKFGTVVPSPAFMTWQPMSYENVKKANEKINKLLEARFLNAVESKQDIVVDMTNMNAAARKNALQAVRGHEHEYHKVAVVFPFKGAEEVIKRVEAKRSKELANQGTPKTLGGHVLDRMFKSFQDVSPDEGFDQIIEQDNREILRSLASGN